MLIETSIVKNINDDVVERLRDLGEHITYSSASHLFYEGQTPVVAYLIVSGTINLIKNKRIKKSLGPKTLIGVKELMLSEYVDFSAIVSANSEVCFLSKSDIMEILGGEDELADKVHQLIAV